MATQVSDAQASAIKSQIAKIQSGINQVAASRGVSLQPTSGGGYTAVPVSQSQNVGAAVNAAGNLVDSSGKVLGKANPADLYSPGATQAPSEKVAPPQADKSATVDTTQPSPTTANATPFTGQTLPYNQALQNLQTGGLTGAPLQTAQDSLRQMYQKAGQLASQSGVPAPQGTGAGAAGVQQFTKATSTPQEPATILGGLQETDGNFDSIFTQFDQYFSPAQQRTSLLDEYQKLSDSLGIESMNHELIDTKRIIDGTEDDIRSEITAAGGFATESQVLAMSNARNKQLIKNYNYLLDSRNAAQTQLQTMMQLTIQDRQFAQQEFDRKMNFAFQVADFQQKAKQNAQTQYWNLISNGMGGALLGDEYQNSIVEKTLGLPSGSLTKLIEASNQQRQLDTQIKQAQLYGQNLSNQKTLQEINTLSSGAGKPVSANVALTLADSEAASRMLNDLTSSIKLNGDLLGPIKGRVGSINPYATRSQDLQSQINSARQVIGKYLEGGVLRKEDEAKYEKILPTLKDTPDVALAKLRNVDALLKSKRNAQTQTLEVSGYNPATVDTASLLNDASPEQLQELRDLGLIQ